jgi:hypothetical protein
MGRGQVYIIGAIVFLAAASAAVGAPPAGRAKPAEPPSGEKSLVQNCDAHRFETTIQQMVDGKPKQSKVRMCGTEGQSDADWLRTLKDAVKKTQASEMPPGVKQQIVAAVNAEIERLSTPALNLPAGGDISKLPKTAMTTTPQVPLSRDYDALPPLPTASNVPPPDVLGTSGALAPAPRVTLRCALAGDEDRPTACDSIDKDTLLVLRADDSYPAGLDLHFVRHGDDRADVSVPALKPGQTAILRLPPRVCMGVVRSRLEIQALGSNAPTGTPAGSVGEYDLRC